jgi:hypothetical protein
MGGLRLVKKLGRGHMKILVRKSIITANRAATLGKKHAMEEGKKMIAQGVEQGIQKIVKSSLEQ